MKLFFCYLLVLVTALLHWTDCSAAVQGCTSTAEKPFGCSTHGQAASNPSDSQAQLRRTFVYATPNRTVYSGQTVAFVFVVDRSETSDVFPVAFVNGCLDETNCTLTSTPDNATRECAFDGVSEANDGLEVHFSTLSPSLSSSQCYNPPSYLTVLGRPGMMDVSYKTDGCSNVCLTVHSPVGPDTVLTYTLSNSRDNVTLYSSTFTGCSTSGSGSSSGSSGSSSSSSGSNNGTIPPELLSDHTGVYVVEVTPANPAGDGPVSTITINLFDINNNTLDDFTVTSISVAVGADNKFYATFVIKVVTDCLLRTTNHLYLSSLCISEPSVVVDVNTTEISQSNGQLTYSHPLVPNMHHCTYLVKDDVENSHSYNGTDSTFHTQNYQLILEPLSNNISVGCSFIRGTRADGCLIIVLDKNNQVVSKNLYRTHSFGYVPLGPFIPGHNYNVLIYDYIDGQVKDNSDHVFKDSFTFPVSTSALTASHGMTTPPSVTTPPSMTTYASPGTTTPPNHVTTVAIVIVVVLGIVVTVIALVVIILLVIRKQKRKSIKVRSPISNIQGNMNGPYHLIQNGESPPGVGKGGAPAVQERQEERRETVNGGSQQGVSNGGSDTHQKVTATSDGGEQGKGDDNKGTDDGCEMQSAEEVTGSTQQESDSRSNSTKGQMCQQVECPRTSSIACDLNQSEYFGHNDYEMSDIDNKAHLNSGSESVDDGSTKDPPVIPAVELPTVKPVLPAVVPPKVQPVLPAVVPPNIQPVLPAVMPPVDPPVLPAIVPPLDPPKFPAISEHGPDEGGSVTTESSQESQQQLKSQCKPKPVDGSKSTVLSLPAEGHDYWNPSATNLATDDVDSGRVVTAPTPKHLLEREVVSPHLGGSAVLNTTTPSLSDSKHSERDTLLNL